MEQTQLVVERELSNLTGYEYEYRKKIMTLGESDDPTRIEAINRLDHMITYIRSWLSILSIEEYCVVICQVVDGNTLEMTIKRYVNCFGSPTTDGEELVFHLLTSGLAKITKMVSEELDSDPEFAKRLGCIEAYRPDMQQ